MNIRKRRSDRSGRAPLPSPGRPPVAGRDERRRFWAAIAAGMASEDAAVEAGVSQAVGTRWFRKAGGMPPAMFGVSAKAALRAISLVCGAGGDRAPSCAGLLHAGDRSPARAGGVDDLAGAAPQRRHAKWRLGVSCDDGAVARRALRPSPEADEACAQLGIAHLCVADLGSRGRDGPARPPEDRRWHAGLLLRSPVLHMQIRRLGGRHHVVVQVVHDHQRAGDDQDDDEHTKRECQHVVGVVWSGSDVQEKDQVNAHLRDGEHGMAERRRTR